MQIRQKRPTDRKDPSGFRKYIDFGFFDVLHQRSEFFFGAFPGNQKLFRLLHIRCHYGMNGSRVRDFPVHEEGKGRQRLSIHHALYIDEAQDHQHGRAADTEDQPEPVGVGAKTDHMVKEKAHREAAAPVRDDHQDEGDARILETAEDTLDRRRNRIKELPSCTIDQELSGNGRDNRVAGIDISDGRAEKHRHRCRHR